MANDQLFKKKKAASREILQRREGKRVPRKRILIVCEGSETERRYFQGLVSFLKITSVDVEVCDECDSAPISVVEFAIEKAKREGSPEHGGYDQVYCVFDRDTHETYEKSKSYVLSTSKSKKFPSKIESIYSIPCFEYWLICHFCYTRAPFSASNGKTVAQSVVDALRKIKGFSEYNKKLTDIHLELLFSGLGKAYQHFKQAENDVIATGEENPRSLVGKLLVDLRSM